MYAHSRIHASLALAALVAATLTLAGCGGEEEPPGQTTAEEPMQAEPPTQQEPPTTPDTSPDTAPSEAPPPESAPADQAAPPPQGSTGGGDPVAAGEDPAATMEQAGCLACHAVDQRRIGPAYAWVAFRYKDDENAADTLAQSIKQGSQGKWTDVTGGAPMPPNPQVSDQQAQALAQWVLSQEPQQPPQ